MTKIDLMKMSFSTNLTVFTRVFGHFSSRLEKLSRQEKNDFLEQFTWNFLSIKLLNDIFGPVLQPKNLFTRKNNKQYCLFRI